MKRVHILIGLLFFLVSFSSFAQAPRSFSNDSVKFIQELTLLFENIKIEKNREVSLETLNRFSKLWTTESFDPAQKRLIYQTSNLMLQKRVKAYPDFNEYIDALAIFKEQSHPEKSFNNWLAGMLHSIESKRNSRRFAQLLDFSSGLLNHNALYQSSIFAWYCSHDYRFEFDTLLYVEIPKFDLKCKTKTDSTRITNTSGTYFPEIEIWKGSNGKIFWSRAGLEENQTFARLDDYQIKLNSLRFEIDSVGFVNKKYFPDVLLGRLEEKVSTDIINPDKVSYPQFESYSQSLYINNIYKDIDFEGGFGMKGAKVYGKGNQYKDATFSFKKAYKNKNDYVDLLVARSKSFVINMDVISASRAGVSIYHQEDSIFHSGLLFKYIHDKREVSMLRIEDGVVQSPYFDTFHDIEIYCEAVYWDMDESVINFRSTKGYNTASKAWFSSKNFYSEQQFLHLQGIDFKHPLVRIRDYTRAYKTNEFFIYELARYMNYPETQIEAMVINLAQQGFLFYDIDNKKAYVTEKLDHFCDSKNAKTDYDVIIFASEVENRENAVLDLDNFDLKINGVPEVSISDSQNVFIYPSKEEVILRKNLDFLFSGKIQAGLFEFNARDCYFEYDTFKLNLPDIESMKFKVRAFDTDPVLGYKPLVEVNTVISNISGFLLIDYPTNKNGLKDFPEYPIFDTKSNSYVYYDHDSAYREAYNRERFYYFLNPFTIEGLSDFSTDSLSFTGYLNSGGIFPEIVAPLTVQPDYSLGFTTSTPADGYDIYNGKGKYTSEIFLSNKGLKGKGTLKYLNSTAQGSDVTFFLDSANANTGHLEMEELVAATASFPSLKASNVYQHWVPYGDSMMITSKDSAMLMFDDLATMGGNLLLTPERLTGKGRMAFFDARMRASQFEYTDHSFYADTTDFFIESVDESGIALSSSNYNANVDFDLMVGNFKTNSGKAAIEFPLNRFMCTMDEFDWFIDRKELVFRNYPGVDMPDLSAMPLKDIIDVDLSGSELMSMHPLQDSLAFYTLNASFSLDSSLLVAEDVKIIKIADAAIFPGDGKVFIRKNADIESLTDATIIADTTNKQHMIHNASVNIKSRHLYNASGSYTFFNAAKEPQIIQFDDIRVDSAKQTYALGNIAVEQEFLFSPRFGFRGEVVLNAKSPLLNFDGAYKPIQDCDLDYSKWVKFNDTINPERLILPVAPEPQEFAENKLYAAFFHSNENNRVYPAFLSRKEYYSDTMMLQVDGFIKTRKKDKEFLIASAEDINITANKAPESDFMSLNTSNCEVKANGEIRFGAQFGQVSLSSFGSIDHFIIPDSTGLKLFAILDFFFTDEALKFMQTNLDLTNTAGINLGLPHIRAAYLNLLGPEEGGKIISDLNLFGTIRTTPEALNKSIVFGDVEMYYDKGSRSFLSVGKIGIGSILGEQINKYYDGYLQVVKKRSGDVLNLYIEVDRRHWYFFSYSKNVMQAISSHTDFNKILREVKDGDRKNKAGKNEVAYRYIISTAQKKNRFLRDMRSGDTPEE